MCLLIILFIGMLVGQCFTTDNINNRQSICSPPFEQVGDYCLFIDRSITGTWQDMQNMCYNLKGSLVTFQDANHLADVIDQIIIKGVNYWTGGNDIDNEGVWLWVNDNSSVHMGTPLWGNKDSDLQDPQGGINENCAALDKDDYYYLHDFTCNNSFSIICQSKPDSKLGINNDEHKLMETNQRFCPHPFENIGDKCLFVNIFGTGNWTSQQLFCEGLGGFMAKVDDANLLGHIFDYLTLNGLNYEHLFLGASDLDMEGDWRWLDGSPVRMGTPFWGGFYEIPQEPFGGTGQNCMVLYYSDFHYFHDYWCTDDIGVLCEYQ